MKLHSPNTLLVIVLVGMVAVPGTLVGTQAVASDDLFTEQEPDLQLEPANAPNGEYVVAGQDDQLKIEFSEPGVNLDAVTDVDRVFTFTNTDTRPLSVWVEHDGGDAVTLSNHATGQDLDSNTSAVLIEPGEQITVDITVNSTGADVGDQLLTTVTIKTAVAQTGLSDVITVPGDEAASIRPLQLADLSDTLQNAQGRPEARMAIDTGQPGATTTVGESLAGIATNQESQVLELAAIESSTGDAVVFELDQGRVTSPDNLVVLQSPSDRDDWELLPTQVEQAGANVTVTAPFDGSATVALVESSALEFSWTLPDGRTLTQPTLEPIRFQEPGQYDIDLGLTDATGASDSTTRTITVTPTEGGEGSNASESETGDTEDPANGDGDGPAGAGGGTDTGTGAVWGVEVVFEGIDGDGTVTELSLADLDTIDAPAAGEGPVAAIDRRRGDGDGANSVITVNTEGVRRTVDSEGLVTRAGNPVELSGANSMMATAVSVTERGQIARAVDIKPPDNWDGEMARIWMAVNRADFSGTAPENARIGHRTDSGWKLLSTDVVASSPETVVLETRTNDFSPFAVFVSPDVQFAWTLNNRTLDRGPTLEHTFEEPGRYNVTLTVTDALGRTDSTDQTVIANDVPTANPRVVSTDEETGNVTLTANIDNEVGNTTVTWTFADGTTKTGVNITHNLEAGEQLVQVRVEDEYGLASTRTKTVAVAPARASLFQTGLESLESLMIPVGVPILLLAGLRLGQRWIAWSAIRDWVGTGPQVTNVGRLTTEPDAGALIIHELTVTSQAGNLSTLTITLLNKRGDSVVCKEVELGDLTEYRSASERIPIPPGVELTPDESYTVRIKVTDVHDRGSQPFSQDFLISSPPSGENLTL
jgi:hypothetical protein